MRTSENQYSYGNVKNETVLFGMAYIILIIFLGLIAYFFLKM